MHIEIRVKLLGIGVIFSYPYMDSKDPTYTVEFNSGCQADLVSILLLSHLARAQTFN